MLAKLLSLLSTAKGAAAAGVIAAAGVTSGVVATNEDAQHAIGTTIQNVAETVTGASTSPKGADSGQPAVVAARNDADKKLRGAFQDDQQKLEKLHSTKVEGDDRGKLGDLIKEADAKLRARLTMALDDVAALTLGREGRETSPPPAAVLVPAGIPASLTDSAKPSPDVKIPLTAETQAKIDGIVKTAIADMDKIVADAEKAVGGLPTFTPGKPNDAPGGKPVDAPGAKPGDAPGGGAPGNRPSPAAPPGRP